MQYQGFDLAIVTAMQLGGKDNVDDWAASGLGRHFECARSPKLMSEEISLLCEAGPHLTYTEIANASSLKAGLKRLRGRKPGEVKPVWKDPWRGFNFALLGTSLMAQALECLPVSFKVSPRDWATLSPKHRRQLLLDMSLSLRSSFWRLHHGELVIERLDLESNEALKSLRVLPKQYGRYPHSLIQPNCLGMSIMITAMCESAGMEYVFANTLRDQESTIWNSYHSVLEHIFNDFERHVGQMPLHLRLAYEEDREPAANPLWGQSFHHCVLIRIAPNNWIVFDPYAAVVGEPEPGYSEQIEAAWRLLRKYRVSMPGLVVPTRLRDFSAYRLQGALELRSCLAEGAGLNSVCGMMLDVNALEIFAILAAVIHKGFLPSTAGPLLNLYGEIGYCLIPRQLRRERKKKLLPQAVESAALHMVFDWSKWDMDDIQGLISRLDTDSSFRRRLIEDLPYYSLRKFIDRLFEPLDINNKERMHFSVELGNPAFQIGSMVLNHLALHDEEFGQMLGAMELAYDSGSQLIWHDAVAGWYNAGCPEADATWANWLLARLNQLPYELLHLANQKMLKAPIPEP